MTNGFCKKKVNFSTSKNILETPKEAEDEDLAMALSSSVKMS